MKEDNAAEIGYQTMPYYDYTHECALQCIHASVRPDELINVVADCLSVQRAEYFTVLLIGTHTGAELRYKRESILTLELKGILSHFEDVIQDDPNVSLTIMDRTIRYLRYSNDITITRRNLLQLFIANPNEYAPVFNIRDIPQLKNVRFYDDEELILPSSPSEVQRFTELREALDAVA